MREQMALTMRGAWVVAAAVFLAAWFAYAPAQWRWLQMSAMAGLEAPLFPGLLSDPMWGLGIYVAPALGVVAFWRLDRVRALFASLLWLGSSVLTAFHLDFYDAASSTVQIWCAAVLVWMAWHLDDDRERTAGQLRLLVRALVALVFSAGFLGKLTPGYLDGANFIEQPIASSPGFFFSGMRALFEGEALEVAAAWYSRFVLVAELGVALSALASFRIMIAVVSATVVGMVMTIGMSVASVVVGIWGLVLATGLLKTREVSFGQDLLRTRHGALLVAMGVMLVLTWSWLVVSWPREQVMRHHQGDPAHVAGWVFWMGAPKMYGFDHEIVHRVRSGTPSEALRRCMQKSRANHMPMAVLTSAYCRSDFSPGVVVEQHLRSTYLGSCWESRWELSQKDGGAPGARVTRQKIASGRCSPAPLEAALP